MSASTADSRAFKVIDLFDKRWTGANADLLIDDLRALSTSGLQGLAKQTGTFTIDLACAHLVDSNDNVQAVELALLVHLFIALVVDGAGVPPSLRSECIARYGSAAIETVEEVVPQQIDKLMREMGASSAQIQAVLNRSSLPSLNASRGPSAAFVPQSSAPAATPRSGEAVCPRCGHADSIQKVSSVLSSGVVNVRYEGNSGYKATSTSVSDLAAQMRLTEPGSPGYGTVGCLGVFGLIMLLGAGSAGGAAIVGLLILLGAGFFAWQISSRGSAAQDEYNRLTSSQNRMYYCHRCDVVFLPGSDRVASPSGWKSLV